MDEEIKVRDRALLLLAMMLAERTTGIDPETIVTMALEEVRIYESELKAGEEE